jgi:hypothetical protein
MKWLAGVCRTTEWRGFAKAIRRERHRRPGMPLHVNEVFTWDVTVGVVVALVGALLALAVSIWWERDRARTHGGRPPLALRVSCAFALGLFSLGMI